MGSCFFVDYKRNLLVAGERVYYAPTHLRAPRSQKREDIV